MKSVAIIGGGITGLTAAFQLRRKGIPVKVFEASDRLGGPIRSVQQGGFLAESGPNTILETAPEVGQLVRELALESRRIYSDPAAHNRYLVRNKKLVSAPSSPAGFFTSPLFSLKAKLSLIREPFVPRRRDGQEETVAEFVLRRLGQEFLDYAINPLVAGIYAGDPKKLSVRYAFAKVAELERDYGSLILGQILGARARRRRAEVSKQEAKKFSFDEGLQVLIDALSKHLGDAIHLGAAVHQARRDQAGWQVTSDKFGTQRFSAVLFSGTAHQLSKLELLTEQRVDLTDFQSIPYPPVASVVLGFRRQDVGHSLDGFGVLIPEIENFRILGTIFSSSLFPNRAPAGHVTLTSYIGGSRAPELALLPERELYELTRQDLSVLVAAVGEPVFRHHTVFRKAIPQYEKGFGRFKDKMSGLELNLPGFFLAGHFRDGVSLSDCIVSAYRAADRIASYGQTSSNPREAGVASATPA